MTKPLPGRFSIRWHKNFKNNLKNKFCRVEHTDTQTHTHIQFYIYRYRVLCQHKLGRRKEVLKFQKISAKIFNVRNQMKSMFATICNKYCIIHCKIKIICLMNSQKLITVFVRIIILTCLIRIKLVFVS